MVAGFRFTVLSMPPDRSAATGGVRAMSVLSLKNSANQAKTLCGAPALRLAVARCGKGALREWRGCGRFAAPYFDFDMPRSKTENRYF